MDWGTDVGVAYSLFIREQDRKKALGIILDILEPYLDEGYFQDFEIEDPLLEYYETSELCNTPKIITFSTLDDERIRELGELQCDGRGRGKVKIVFGVEVDCLEYTNAETLLETFD